MSWSNKELVSFVQERLKELADPEKAPGMAAYMKNQMPFYGVQKPDRVAVYREIKKRFVPADRKQYESAVRALWKQSMREERYTAIEYARAHNKFIGFESLPLYENLIRDGAWWDLVDELAQRLVGEVYLKERKLMSPVIEQWIEDDDMWIRRTALISQNRHKEATDGKQLFRHCLARAGETEFFIRKAIGWALREYSYTAPDAVHKFLLKNRDRLSGLSFREGAKQLARSGQFSGL